jgi:cytochrome c oxidase assembly protein subunit 15
MPGVDDGRRAGLRTHDAGGGRQRDRIIAGWLLAVAAMVFGMVVLGGLTRLTQSGLSMVEWKPLTGWLPPMSHDAWVRTFEAYQQYPEFKLRNPDMTLLEFEGIFWLEFIHRLWGRLTGVVFLVPFAIFLVRGWIRGRLAIGCAGLFLLGGLQGVLGWYMVKSGMIDRPDVSAYRLTAHFVMALLLFGALLWLALGRLRPAAGGGPAGRPAWPTLGLATLILVTLSSGGFVAGTDAGYHFNTFPMMDGRWVPDDLFVLDPAWRNYFENVPLVQFNHRVLALATLLAVLVVRFGPLAAAAGRGRSALNAVVALTLLQVALGVSTLLLHMPIALAALHQANGVLLWAAALWAVFENRPAGVATAAVAGTSRSLRAAGGGRARLT